MKILPIVIADFTKRDKQNVLLREYVRQGQAKLDKILFINTHEQKPDISKLIAEKDNIDFSEKIKQLNKEMFEKK